jgi:Ca2+/H+ antiporter
VVVGAGTRLSWRSWTVLVPAAAAVALLLSWGRELPYWAAGVVAVLIAGAVFAAVHHAEVVAARVGEPFGSLVLAVAVTVIEVGLIVTLMVGEGEKTASLAQDTVFAAARRDRIQTSLNLAYGSAMASIGLTIPAIAVASIWLSGPLVLGLEPTQLVLLAITVVAGILTVVPGPATPLQGGIHPVDPGRFPIPIRKSLNPPAGCLTMDSAAGWIAGAFPGSEAWSACDVTTTLPPPCGQRSLCGWSRSARAS